MLDMPSILAPRSTLLIPVPEVSSLVHDYRLRFDPTAAQDMPEHITLLYPFLDPSALEPTISANLKSILGSVQPFSFTLSHVGWFRQDVLFLAPEPMDPFIDLSKILSREFAILPYEGRHQGIHPHLTVAQTADHDSMQRIASAIYGSLPVRSRANEVWLMVRGPDGPWRLHERIELGGNNESLHVDPPTTS